MQRNPTLKGVCELWILRLRFDLARRVVDVAFMGSRAFMGNAFDALFFSGDNTRHMRARPSEWRPFFSADNTGHLERPGP